MAVLPKMKTKARPKTMVRKQVVMNLNPFSKTKEANTIVVVIKSTPDLMEDLNGGPCSKRLTTGRLTKSKQMH